MDKAKKLLKKVIEMVKSGRMTLQEIKKINPKLLFQVLLDKVLAKVKAVASGLAIKVIICCLIIGVILLIFYGIMQLLMAILEGLQALWDAVQYVFIGTASQVNADDIKKVREELDNMNVDFEEIGYIGAIKQMGGVEDYEEYKRKLDNIDDEMIAEFKKIDNTYQPAIDQAEKNLNELRDKKASQSEIDEAQKKLDEAKEKLSEYADENINYYVEEYLIAEKQTSAQYDRNTLSDKSGAVRIKQTDVAEEFESWWSWWGDTIQGSYDVELIDGKFYTDLDGRKIDITDEVYDMYMPWRYPFTFHNETLSPDVGYLVAKLNKYHFTTIYIDVSDILLVYSHSEKDSEGNSYAVLDDVKWIDDDDYEIEIEDSKASRTIVALPAEVHTWASTVKYKYYYKGKFSEVLKYDWDVNDPEESKFNEDSKDKLEDHFKASGNSIVYSLSESPDNGKSLYQLGFKYLGVDGDSNVYWKEISLAWDNNIDRQEIIEKNKEGYQDMKDILFPVPKGEVDGSITNINDVPKYYTANAGEKDKDGKYTGKPAVLNITTNAEAIIQAVDEIYRHDTDKNMLRGDPLNAPVTPEQYKEASSKTAPFVPDLSVKMVADVVELFNGEEIIDLATYFGSGLDAMYAGMDTVWFLKQDEVTPFDKIQIDADGVATIPAEKGTTIVSPITGEVETIIENDGKKTIILVKYGKPDPADPNSEKVPVMKIFLGGIVDSSCTEGQKVTAGQTILGLVSDSGKITYEHLDGSGQSIGKEKTVEELNKMISVENLEFGPPLPKVDINNREIVVSSWFGPRKAPTYGASSWHKGIDLGAPTGTPIYAIADGFASAHFENGGYGNYVVVKHDNNKFISEYGHMSKTLVPSGGQVKKGDIIGLVGSTGASTGPHLHLTIKLNGTAIDPLDEAGLHAFYGPTKPNY